MKSGVTIGGGIVIALAITCLGAPAASDTGSADLTTIEALTAQWVTLRTELAAEARAWEEQRRHLDQELSLLTAEEQRLTESLATLRQEAALVNNQRADLIGERSALDLAATRLNPTLLAAEARLRAIHALLPPSLRPLVDDAFVRLPSSETAARTLTAAQRLHYAAAFAEALAAVTRSVHVTREVLTDPQGNRREMEALFLGATQGYAVTADGRWAATGKPAAEGWLWTPAPEAADAIRDAIGKTREGTATDTLRLPLQIGAPTP